MNTNDRDLTIDTWIVLLVCAALWLFALVGAGNGCGDVQAQEPELDRQMLELGVRLRVSEADFTVGCYMPDLRRRERARCVTDAAVLAWVIRARASVLGVSWTEMARRYAPSATGASAPQSRRHGWVQQLTLDGAEPPAWRSLVRLSWDRHRRPIFERIVAEMRHVLTHWPNPCRGGAVPEHWGIPCGPDGRPENPARRVCDGVPDSWERLDCGPSVNAPYFSPRTERARRARGRDGWWKRR